MGDVELEQRVPLVVAHLEDREPGVVACVRDQDVDRGLVCAYVSDGGAQCVGVGEIDDVQPGLDAMLEAVLHYRFSRRAVLVDHCDRATLPCESAGDGGADAVGAAGDEDVPTGQVVEVTAHDTMAGC